MKKILKETAIEAFQRLIYGIGFGGGMSISFSIASKYGIEKPEHQQKKIKQ
tara:strand:- start:1370 stop:1522 length:153 start_codon:yes stop_codon:yes gene_type:complete